MPKVKCPRKIRELVKKANAGCGEAAWAIARHYDNGSGGVEKNEALDVQWTEKSAALGYSLAQLVLGVRMRDKGDYTSARAWFEKSAAGGVEGEAEFALGSLYYEGQGVEKNPATAIEWWRAGALKGGVHAQYNLGAVLSDYLHEYTDAVLWLEKAAAQGFVDAMDRVGILYFCGDGVERNARTAMIWWLKASRGGSVMAKENLLKKFRHGDFIGIESAYVLHENLFVELAEYGDEDSVQRLNRLRKNKRGTLLVTAKRTGLELSEDAVERFVSGPLPEHEAKNTFHHLALCFLHGRCGLEKNLRMAKEVFKECEIYDPDNAAVAEELVKLRSCVTCGKTDARWGCKLCRGVRYCNKRCQQRDWNRGEPPHKETCSRVVHMYPPGHFADLRTYWYHAKKRGESA
jgi:TPR repeat protein